MVGREPNGNNRWEENARLRERVAGMEKEIPLLRTSTEQQISALRNHLDEKITSQNLYIDRKFADLAQAIRVTPVDTRLWWTMLAIGALVALTLITVVAFWIASGQRGILA